jgi:hypothetical protein
MNCKKKYKKKTCQPELSFQNRGLSSKAKIIQKRGKHGKIIKRNSPSTKYR